MKKTITQRMQEVRRLNDQLEALGFHEEMEPIAEFRKIAQGFVRSGVATSGTIDIPFARRKLVYEFVTNPHVPCNILVKSY